MILVIESFALCMLFTIMVYIMSREPIKTLYNYPPKIQERVKSLDEYHNYWFHIKGSLFGEVLALVICAIVGLVIQFIL